MPKKVQPQSIDNLRKPGDREPNLTRKVISANLLPETIEMAIKLGNGNKSAGIDKAFELLADLCPIFKTNN